MKRFEILPLMLALSSLACVTVMGNAGQSPAQAPAGQAPVQPPLLQLPNLSGVQLGDEFRDEGCGFSFRKVPGYAFDATSGFGPMMTAPGANIDSGPIIEIFCGVHDNARTNEDLIKELTADPSGTPEANPITYSNQKNVSMGGVNAITIDSEGAATDGILVKGRVAMAMVTPYRGVVLAGLAPADKWEEVRPYFEAVMNSVTFFEPTVIPTP